MASENTPLAPASKPYFVPHQASPRKPYLELGPNDEDRGAAPGLETSKPTPFNRRTSTRPPRAAQGDGFWSWMNRPYAAVPSSEARGGGHAALPRKVPVKVEPKVFFANERTYLAWVHMAVILASMSVGIVALAERETPAGYVAKLYGASLMPVAIGFVLYALHNYLKRTAMLSRRDPGPYDDAVGPTVMGGLLLAGILANAFVKFYTVYYW